MYLENEFRKRQSKRRGIATSPSVDGLDNPDNMYTALMNNPEFANVLMSLLAQKAGPETSVQLMELLKNNPDSLRVLLESQTSMQKEQLSSVPSELLQPVLEQTSAAEAVDSTNPDHNSQLDQPDVMSLDTHNPKESMADHEDLMQSMSRPAPIPRVGVKMEDSPSPIIQSSIPPSRPSIPKTAQIPIPQTVAPPPAQSRPSQDRIRAMGFPPPPR